MHTDRAVWLYWQRCCKKNANIKGSITYLQNFQGGVLEKTKSHCKLKCQVIMINYVMAEFTAIMQLLQDMTECLFLFVLKGQTTSHSFVFHFISLNGRHWDPKISRYSSNVRINLMEIRSTYKWVIWPLKYKRDLRSKISFSNSKSNITLLLLALHLSCSAFTNTIKSHHHRVHAPLSYQMCSTKCFAINHGNRWNKQSTFIPQEYRGICTNIYLMKLTCILLHNTCRNHGCSHGDHLLLVGGWHNAEFPL